MGKAYLVGPLVCTFACWTYGNGLLPLLPIYAIERGASQAMAGVLLAYGFLCLAVGSAAAGLLPRRFGNRKLLIACCGAAIAVLTWFVGKTTTLIPFGAMSGACWFFAGIIFSQTAILVGMSAAPKDRGTAFGILAATNGLGSLLGGLGIGYAADRLGFESLFTGIAVFCLLIVVGALVSVEPRPDEPLAEDSAATGQAGGSTKPLAFAGAGLLLLLAAQLLLSVNNSTGNLGRSLSMSQLKFDKLTIDLTASVTGIVAMCFPVFLGWLSDKVGRRKVLVAAYLLTGASMVVLAFSRSPWQFYLFAGLFAFIGVPLGIGPAYVMDLVPHDSAARAVSFFQTAFWVGSIAGMAAAGVAFQHLGLVAPILGSSLFAGAGIVLLLLIRTRPAVAMA